MFSFIGLMQKWTVLTLLKLTKTFGLAEASEELEIPSKYIILNPSDIQLQGSITFSTGIYYKVVTDYELQRLRYPQTEEDKEVYDSLPEETKKLIQQSKNVGAAAITIPLDVGKANSNFLQEARLRTLCSSNGVSGAGRY